MTINFSQKISFKNKGEMATIRALSVFQMPVRARIGEPDLLWTVNMLAPSITTWNKACAKRLARLKSYINHTKHYGQHCFVGDDFWDCKIWIVSGRIFCQIFATFRVNFKRSIVRIWITNVCSNIPNVRRGFENGRRIMIGALTSFFVFFCV